MHDLGPSLILSTPLTWLVTHVTRRYGLQRGQKIPQEIEFHPEGICTVARRGERDGRQMGGEYGEAEGAFHQGAGGVGKERKEKKKRVKKGATIANAARYISKI